MTSQMSTVFKKKKKFWVMVYWTAFDTCRDPRFINKTSLLGVCPASDGKTSKT